jgi:hypothetical protein
LKGIRADEIVSATGDLRVASGNQSAEAVAPVFGVGGSQLADGRGRSRQALTKTPDADSLQTSLGASSASPVCAPSCRGMDS